MIRETHILVLVFAVILGLSLAHTSTKAMQNYIAYEITSCGEDSFLECLK